MVLMPEHILFLQLIIDPACSLVFEAESVEQDAMQQKPRRWDVRLFDAAFVVRCLWQGAGLLAPLLAGYAVALAWTCSHHDLYGPVAVHAGPDLCQSILVAYGIALWHRSE